MATKWVSLDKLRYALGKVYTLLGGKVDKVEGKGLSSNDYTAADKNKLAGIDTGANNYTHPAHSNYASGLYKIVVDALGHVTGAIKATKSDITALGIPGQDTTYGPMTGAEAAAGGQQGLVPAPAAGEQAKYLRGDGTWGTPPNTTYSAMTGSTASAAGKTGLVPVPAAGTQAKYLRGDGTWQTPPNTTYSPATASANGLMSSADKSKLDAFGAAANYALKSDITAMYRYKGSVADVSKLPTSGQIAGDVYDIQTESVHGPAGTNVAWNGTAWDALGGKFELQEATNADIDQIFTDLAS